jgi:tricorn protease
LTATKPCIAPEGSRFGVRATTSAFLAIQAAFLVVGPVSAARQVRTDSTTREAIGPAESRGYFRYPAIHGNTIVFTAEGDLWRTAITGGAAVRLTTYPEVEARPAISPDGRWLAYTAAYEGPREVYVMPLDGGPAVRQTWEGASADVIGWLSDDRLLYATRKYSTLPVTRLVAIRPCTDEAVRSRAPGAVCSPGRELLPLAGAAAATLARDGTLFFTRWPAQSSYTKRYVGGTAESIWKWHPAQSADSDRPGSSRGGPEARAADVAEADEAVPLTSDYPGTSTAPMFWNGRIWFLSDRAKPGTAHSLANHGVSAWDIGVMNIWSMNPDGSDVRQHTFHTDYDAATPSLDDGHIVYQQGADLWVLDLNAANPAPRRLTIQLSSDFDQLRENWVDRPMDFLTSVHIAPSGDRVALTSRGRVFVAPVGAGRLVEADREQGVRYREARFMPDGHSVLALSDETGEVELWTLPASGIGERTQLTKDARILRWQGIPSPDGRFIAHNDKNQDLWIYDTKSKDDRKIHHSDRESTWISSAPGSTDLAWSPDGRWLVYNDVAPNFLGRLVLYDTRDDSHHPITSDRYDSWGAMFSPDGNWLWFLSDRTFQTSVGSPWGPRQPDPYYDRSTKIYGLALKAGAAWPFRPADEFSSDSAERSAAPRTEASPRSRTNTAAADSVVPIDIDLDGVASRLYEVPVPAGNLSSLATDGRRLYWIGTEGSPGKRNLMSLEISRRSPKPATVVEDVTGYELSQDRSRLMVRKGRDIYVFDAGPHAPQNLNDSRVDLSAWAFSVDPREEWQNQFVDAWRLERDYFYDPGMNGIDWPAMRTKYAPLAARVTDRNELNDVLAQMVGELSALHIFVRGGDVRDGPDDISIGSLGAILDRDAAAGGWRVSHVYRSDPDIPSDLAPLARPGLDVREGDVITAIDGTPTLAVPDPNVLLRNKVGRQVRLTIARPGAASRSARGGPPPQTRSVAAAGDAMARRDVIVEPISAGREASLRYTDWEYSRRLAVDSLGSGRIGYVHLRAMSGGNMTEWARDYYPVFNRDGLIIDVRHNTGGNIDSWLLGKLLRRDWFWWKPRVGEPYANMPYSFRGPIVVLVDEATASDGEAFAEGFRRLGLGKVIGVRTWGGEIWLSSSNFLADRGIATAAEQGVYADGKWLIEGWGVEPDVHVDNLPVRTFAGGDAQLEAAVHDLLDQLRQKPVVVPPPPAYPRKSGRGDRSD